MISEENKNDVGNELANDASPTPVENPNNTSVTNDGETTSSKQNTSEVTQTVEIQKTIDLGNLNPQYSTYVDNQNQNFANHSNSAKLLEIDQQNQNKWADIGSDVYNKFVIVNNENADVFKQFVNTAFGKEKDKIFATDDLIKQIDSNKAFIVAEKKRLKIIPRKIANGFIIFFCVIVVGVLLISFLTGNKKVIKKFNLMVEDTNKKNIQLNEQKNSDLRNIYSQFTTTSLLNHFLSYFGMRFIHEYNNFNVHNLIENKNADICAITSVIPFKIGNHLFINYQYVTEEWKNVTSSITIKSKHLDNPELTEDVSASHEENTPFRELKNEVYTNFRGGLKDYWNLSSINLEKGKKQKTIKEKELAKLQFDKCFVVSDKSGQKSVTDANISQYLTPTTQDTMLKIYHYFDYKNLKMEFFDGIFHANSYFFDYQFYTWNSINQFLDYANNGIAGSDSINQIENKFNQILNELIYTPSFLWSITQASEQMLLNPIDGVNTTLKFGRGYANQETAADLETVLTQAKIHNCINTKRETDAFKNRYFYHFNFYDKVQNVDVYWCDLQSYFTSEESANVPVRTQSCGIVNVSVPYVKYNEFFETKVFFVCENNTDLLGSFSLAAFKENKNLINILGANISSTWLICTPELKIVVANHSISRGQEFNVIIDFIKEVGKLN